MKRNSNGKPVRKDRALGYKDTSRKRSRPRASFEDDLYVNIAEDFRWENRHLYLQPEYVQEDRRLQHREPLPIVLGENPSLRRRDLQTRAILTIPSSQPRYSTIVRREAHKTAQQHQIPTWLVFAMILG